MSGVLYRAVGVEEHDDIAVRGYLRVPAEIGAEVKYFAPTREEAERYARMAQAQLRDGTYWIVEASVPAGVAIPAFQIVDGNIRAIVMDSAAVDRLEVLGVQLLP